MNANSPIPGHNEAAPVRDARLLMKARPEHEFFSESQAEAHHWIQELDLVTTVRLQDGKKEGFTGIAEIDTHWVTVTCLRNKPNPKHNGYYVTLSAKAKVSPAQMKKVLATLGAPMLRPSSDDNAAN